MDLFGCVGKSKHSADGKDKPGCEISPEKAAHTSNKRTDVDSVSTDEEEPAIFSIPFWEIDPEEGM